MISLLLVPGASPEGRRIVAPGATKKGSVPLSVKTRQGIGTLTNRAFVCVFSLPLLDFFALVYHAYHWALEELFEVDYCRYSTKI